MNKKLKFSQRHPFWFGFGLIILAMVLISGTMAFFNLIFKGKTVFTWGRPKIGVVYVQGVIQNSIPITRWINQLSRDKSIKAILVRIDSPGGVVGPSQEIYQALKKAQNQKLVIASMGAVAASGGYYVALGAQKIIANPGTITASIGVKASLTNFKGLLDKLGIQDQTLVSGKLKDAGSPFRPLTPEEKTYLQKLIDNLHQQFVQAVVQSRDLPLDKVQKIADGRAMTGQQALKYGLIDGLGGFDYALTTLCKLLKIKTKPILVEGPKTETSLLSKLLSLTGIKPHTIWGPRWILSYE